MFSGKNVLFGASRHVTALSAVFALLGGCLFAYTLWRTGVAAAFESVAGIGLRGFLLILALSGARLALRSVAWMRCVEHDVRLGFVDAFRATLMGEALTAVTPLANIVGEPAKALFVKRKVALNAALSGIVVENIFYSGTVAVMVAVGTIVLLVVFEPAAGLRWAGYGAIAVAAAILLLVLALLAGGIKPATRAVGLVRGLTRQGPAGAAGHASVRSFEAGINGFYARNRDKLVPLLLLEGGFHLASIAETYVTLLLLGGVVAPTLLAALVLDSAGRVINVMFRFVPMRMGVDEAGSAIIARAVGLGAVAGVALALVRKARTLAWTAVGIALLLHRGISPVSPHAARVQS